MSRRPSPSGEREGGAARPFPILVLLVGAILLIRLAVAASLHLTEDEAYYRLWSFSPAFGYFDHPPMIAWWIWLGRGLAGDTSLGVRLLPSLACALDTLLVFDMVRVAGGARGGALRAAVWFNAMLLVAAGGFLAVPDAPASLFWALALWSAMRARREATLAWWLGAGIAAGLAALSKYSALFLAPGVLLWLAWDATGRAQLRRPGPWLAAGVAVAIFSSNIAWNGAHHWVSFAKQFGRVAPGPFQPRYVVEFIGGQILLLNPLVALFAARRVAARSWGTRAPSPAGETGGIDITPFVATSGPFVAYLFLHSLHDRVQAHWPAPVYPAIAILAAAGAAAVTSSWWIAPRRVTPLLAPALCAALLALVAFRPQNPGLPDVARPIEGWSAFAARLEAARVRLGAGWIATTSYGLAAELADEPGVAAPIFQISERDRYAGFGEPRLPDPSRPGLLVDLPRRIDPAKLAACFATVEPLGRVSRVGPGGAGTAYSLYRVTGPRADLLSRGC